MDPITPLRRTMCAIRTTHLLVTLPRHTGETLAATNGLTVHDCPFPVDGFTVAQHRRPMPDEPDPALDPGTSDVFCAGGPC